MNDKALQQFLQQHKQEIPDNGFTRKVMNRLPARQPAPPLVWIFAAIGTLLFFAINGYQRGIEQMAALMEKAPWWIFPVAGTAVVTVFLVAFLLHEHKTTVSLSFNR